MYGRNSDKGGDLTDVGASAIGRAINKEFNLMDAGCSHTIIKVNFCPCDAMLVRY